MAIQSSHDAPGKKKRTFLDFFRICALLHENLHDTNCFERLTGTFLPPVREKNIFEHASVHNIHLQRTFLKANTVVETFD